MNIAIVTGASSGMGREFVRQISDRYTKLDEIWVIARRKERLVELSESVDLRLRILDLDITDESDFAKFSDELNKVKPNVRMLVNSAGFGHLGYFENEEYKYWDDMINLNCKALTKMCYETLPYMRRGSRIINLASSAAFAPQPGFNIYAATKSFVLSFSRALGGELRSQGISVTAVCPGPVKTEFFDIADPKGETKFLKKLVMVNPENVVFKALDDAKMGRSVSVYGVAMNAFSFASKLIPHDFIVNFCINWK